MYLFLDFETTGLNPEICKPLEVAAAIYEDPRNKPLGTFHSFIQLDPFTYRWEEVAHDMHRKSGLWDEWFIDRAGTSETDVDQKLAKWISAYSKKGKLNLSGNSVHFDRSFLVAGDWYYTLEKLTHRHLDVSSFRLVCDTLGVPKFGGEPAHRAAEDVKRSVEEFRYYLRALGGL